MHDVQDASLGRRGRGRDGEGRRPAARLPAPLFRTELQPVDELLRVDGGRRFRLTPTLPLLLPRVEALASDGQLRGVRAEEFRVVGHARVRRLHFGHGHRGARGPRRPDRDHSTQHALIGRSLRVKHASVGAQPTGKRGEFAEGGRSATASQTPQSVGTGKTLRPAGGRRRSCNGPNE